MCTIFEQQLHAGNFEDVDQVDLVSHKVTRVWVCTMLELVIRERANRYYAVKLDSTG